MFVSHPFTHLLGFYLFLNQCKHFPQFRTSFKGLFCQRACFTPKLFLGDLVEQLQHKGSLIGSKYSVSKVNLRLSESNGFRLTNMNE